MQAPRQVRSSCPYCGVGCGIVMDVEGDRVVRVRGDADHPANRGRLCTKGSTCAQPLSAPERLTRAMRRPRRDAALEETTLDAAVSHIAARLGDIVARHGPDAVAIYVSGQMSIEAQYLANKLAKGFVRTQHIESNSRLCMASAGAGYKSSLGSDAPPGSYEDLDAADLFVVIGANMADCHPILFLRLLDRKRAGARLIVVDPRRTATADKADLFLQIRPGTDLALLNGLLHLLASEHAACLDHDFIAKHTSGWPQMAALLADYPPARVAALTGIEEAALRQAASWIAGTRQWMSLWTMGLNQSTAGTFHTNALCNLHLATGTICRPGAGPFSLTGQPNAMGGREMGYMGPGLPGQRSALVAADRAFVEERWSLPHGHLRAEPGQGTVAMFEAMARGEIRACWIICTNPVASMPNRDRAIAGLRRAEFVVVQDAFADAETAAYADMLLPAGLWAEGDGVQVNSDRTLTLCRQAVPPPGDALPDWALIARVACAMGFAAAFTYADAAEVFDELAGFANPATGYDIGGVSHARLRTGPVQWPSPPGDTEARHPIRYLAAAGHDGPVFAHADGRARFLARPFEPRTPTGAADGLAFTLGTGRLQHQWHTLTKTGRVETLNRLNPGPAIELHPDDAARLDVAAGDTVAITSANGRAELPAAISDRVAPGTCFAPFHWADRFGANRAVNVLTPDTVDPISLQPGLKLCHVALARTAPSAAGHRAVPPAAPATSIAGARILVASQTGRAEMVAEQLRCALAARGCDAMLARLDTAGDEALGGTALFVVSTFGDGEPPDQAATFWARLQAREAALDRLDYAVIALGDPSYRAFCGFGRALDARLLALGAVPLAARVECDPDRDGPDPDWLDGIAARLPKRTHAPTPGKTPVTQGGGGKTPITPSRAHPAPATLTLNRRLTPADSRRDTRLIGFDLTGTGITYAPGGALGVWPCNAPGHVALALRAFGLGEDTELEDGAGGLVPAAELLAHRYDLLRPSPALLERLGASLPAYLPDLLAACDRTLPVAQIGTLLRRQQPRLYSIASSTLAVGASVHLTVGVADTPYPGLSSGFLARSVPGTRVRVWSQPAVHFALPADDVPIVMIGPGTGIAPFRGFLQERGARAASGRNWLFFGERHAAEGFYYRDELDAWRRDGLLTRLDTAFSRDAAAPCYVQHRMRQAGRTLYEWLLEGAIVYVCGDAGRMARDVDCALREIVATHGGLSREDAEAHVDDLLRTGRIRRDVY